MYYQDKIPSLKQIFGTDEIELFPQQLVVAGKKYPILDDVIILTDPSQYTSFVRQRLGKDVAAMTDESFAEDVQFSFGEEWKVYSDLLLEHQREFQQYFDLVELSSLRDKRVCDLGCGMGRWSHFLQPHVSELVLLDFSDAIFVARRNLAAARNCLFFMGDLQHLAFKPDFADLIFSLGVLHHLPTPCLEQVRRLRPYSPKLLIFLYYALDNRPWYFRSILSLVSVVRRRVSGVRSGWFRKAFSLAGTFGIYLPLILLGWLLEPFGLSSHVPLYDFYRSKGVRRIEQDVYDRFFTSIEQRVSRTEILTLTDAFQRVQISEELPYWHFLCER